MAPPLKVAVIGAGMAGLAAARALNVEGHQVSVYEKSNRLGGTWVYDPRVESDPLGLDPDREVVHGSLYSSLRTNNPRQLMGFSDYPFGSRTNGDSRTFPGHEEMLSFLNEFAEEFGLVELIRFNTEVVRVERVGSRNDEWVVESRNGHSGSEEIVVVIGGGPSAIDISADICKVAKQVHLSSRNPNIEISKVNYADNIWQHSKIDCIDEHGVVCFEDGACLHADIILHCTGYNYQFPFLRTDGIVTVDDNRVGPLYKHVFPPKLAPNLSFIGLTYRVSYEYMDWLANQAGTPEMDEETKLNCKSYFKFVAENGVWKAKEWEPENFVDPRQNS
ncbi:Flavin-containing monooxygenase FMO GS-OX-like 7 [Sesamum alatum]|uniref:Flavin-containing monooxygenase n=1 Tax=Sesamum alatum TaxID=300844 RepID=A0AAE2CA67_9LAMI|nr:Flavin-containing monooxygenase FMO GS-OX-like 7 [Sesamum alatum]